MLGISQEEILAGFLNGMFSFGKAFVAAMPWYGWVIIGGALLAKYVEKRLRILTR